MALVAQTMKDGRFENFYPRAVNSPPLVLIHSDIKPLNSMYHFKFGCLLRTLRRRLMQACHFV
jgi:hypothetical protein